MIASMLHPFSTVPPLALLIEWIVLVVVCAIVMAVLALRQIR